MSIWALDNKDHPRSCGEYRRRADQTRQQVGSSPLMRGIQERGGRRNHIRRIIPAHAGNTSLASRTTLGGEDHPRSCGEYFEVVFFCLFSLGSSPLMRGIPIRIPVCMHSKRIIPAHAGNTPVFKQRALSFEDHPRSCGEYPFRVYRAREQ